MGETPAVQPRRGRSPEMVSPSAAVQEILASSTAAALWNGGDNRAFVTAVASAGGAPAPPKLSDDTFTGGVDERRALSESVSQTLGGILAQHETGAKALKMTRFDSVELDTSS